MPADKQSRALNRYNAYRVTQNQLGIWRLYNSDEFLVQQKVPGFRKRKAMNCSCRTCRGWAQDAKQFRFNWQLEKQGMKAEKDLGLVIDHGVGEGITSEEYDGLGTVHLREEDWI